MKEMEKIAEILNKNPKEMEADEFFECLPYLITLGKEINQFIFLATERDDMRNDSYYKRVQQGLSRAEVGSYSFYTGLEWVYENK